MEIKKTRMKVYWENRNVFLEEALILLFILMSFTLPSANLGLLTGRAVFEIQVVPLIKCATWTNLLNSLCFYILNF